MLPEQPSASRIAVFQAYWRLHSSTAFLVEMLEDAGYFVDVFLYAINDDTPQDIIHPSTRVSICHCGSPKRRASGKPNQSRDAKSVLRSLVRRGWSAVKIIDVFRYLIGSNRGLIPNSVLDRSRAIIGQRKYKALIGIEKGGILWAGMVKRHAETPLIYSNLELYTRNHWWVSGLWRRRLKLAEEMFHRRCRATIVQDYERAQILLRDNRVALGMRMIYLPIGRLGTNAPTKSSWLQERLGVSNDVVIILSYGMIEKRRYSIALAKIAQKFDPNWLLVFHGWGPQAVLDEVRSGDVGGRVKLSLQLVDMADEPNIVSSAKISLILYDASTDNDQLTGFSSEKLALSLQCGVPVIAFDRPTFGHVRDGHCGVLIKALEEIPSAIAAVLSDYAGYRRGALSTFDKHYRYEKNFGRVLSALDEL